MITYSTSVLFGQPAGKSQNARKSFFSRFFAHVFLLALGFFQPLATQGVVVPSQQALPNLDKRTENNKGISRFTTIQEQAIRQLQSLIPSAKVDEDEILGISHYVRAVGGLLTGPLGEGGAVSAKTASAFSVNDPNRAVKGFLNEHAALFGYGAEVLTGTRLKREFVTAHNGMRSVVWEQQVDGIAVFGGVLAAHTTKQGELISLSSGFVPEAQKTADAGAPNRKALIAAPTISAQQAVARAAAQVDEKLQAQDVVLVDAATGADQQQSFTAKPLLGKTNVKLVWLPITRSTMRLCWEVILTSRTRGEMFRVLIDAQTGEVWLRHCLTNYISDASYRVFTSDSPSPFSPSHSTPSTNQPPLVERQLVTWSAWSTNASPVGWINDGENTTLGNNVDAHLDRDGNNVPDSGSRPTGSPLRVFDFSLDLNQNPVTYTNAAVAQLFYWNNWIHDRLYDLGFIEAAGNFQNNNFGRGGLGNDAVQADAQDGSGVNNANFSTPPDGSAPRMQMFLFSGPTPDRDGDLDAEIILHEYTHGLSNRRVGGGVGLWALQSGGLGEGWSDFYPLALLSETADDVRGNYTTGGYATYLLDGLTQNYYFGIRRYPYTTDMTKNPLTYKDINPTQASPHTGVPRNPIIGNTADEVHNMGEVWCVTLWEARANLIHKWGYAVGNRLILQLVTDAMNLSPGNPTYLQARDAILQADQINHGGANRLELWSAFAKRGMGWSATSPSSSTTEGLSEAFDMPDDLSVEPRTGMTSKGLVGGPFVPSSRTYTLANVGSNTISWMGSSTATWLDLSSVSGSLSPGGPPATVVVSISTAAASLGEGIYTSAVTFSNRTSGMAQTFAFTLRVGQPDYFTELFDTATNDLAYQMVTFAPDGSSSFYAATRDWATAFPTDPSGGTALSLSDDSYAQVMLSGAQVCLFGVNYPSFFVGSNGYITFGNGDTAYSESLANHFKQPRISALFDDLNPNAGGDISWKQLSDRVVVTFQNVREYSSTRLVSFQIELFFDGPIRITYLHVGIADGLVGLSRGTGVPVNFFESDFTFYPPSDFLTVDPGDDLRPQGYAGGPFAPSNKVYLLSNVGSNHLTWSATHAQTWVNVSVGGGTLIPGATTQVVVSLNAQAATLSPGRYVDGVAFSNMTSGAFYSRPVILTVQEIPGEIEVLDSIVPAKDLAMPFGPVIVGLARTERITVRNTNGLYDLIISDIDVGEYLEDFNDGFAQDWVPTVSSQWAVVFGEYRAQAGRLGEVMQSMYTGGRWQDCGVEVHMRRTGYLGSASILAVHASNDFDWRTDRGSAYGVGISGDGSYWVGKWVHGNFTFLQPWTASSYLHPGETTNDVVLSARGTTLGVYFNGHLAWSGSDSDIPGAGRVVLGGYSGSFTETIHYYDDVVVGEPVVGGELSAEQSWYNTHAYEGGTPKMAPAGWNVPTYRGDEAEGKKGDTDLSIQSLVRRSFRLENVPAMPYRIAPSGALQIDVVFEPTTRTTNQTSLVIESNDDDEPVVEVQLSGEGIADDLQVIPEMGLSSSGQRGGPFSPSNMVYTLSNGMSGTDSLAWTATAAQNWLTVTPGSGTLAAGASEVLTVRISSVANGLPIGAYSDMLIFSNRNNGVIQRRGVLLEVMPTEIYFFPLDTDPGWSVEGQWAFGQPQGQRGDPNSGHTGSNVYGYNLAGSYSNSMPAYYLTMGPLDCFQYEKVGLRFWRWLGVENAVLDHANVQASADGVNWMTVWEHTGSSFQDTSWKEMTYDLSAVADGRSTVYLRWGMGPTDGSVVYSGWNIDDIVITGDEIDHLAVSPREGWESSGYIGGPFHPSNAVYTLSNDGTGHIAWTATAAQDWLTVMPASGEWGPGVSGEVKVEINSGAVTLPGGIYTNTVTFSNATSGAIQARTVTLTVLEAPQPPSFFHYVALGGGHRYPFTNWVDAATNIQAAIDAAEAQDTIWVADGVYDSGGRVVHGALSNRVAITKPVTVRSVNGPMMTIIQGAGPVGDSAVRCAYVGSNAVLEGFTLTNGATRSDGDVRRELYGGGVWCESSGVLSNCVLTGNSAYRGGGVYYGTLYNCTLTGNSASLEGGGAFEGTLYNCMLTGNSAYYGGGGVSDGTLYNCTLTGNSASHSGGGASHCMLYNCIVYYNDAAFGPNYYSHSIFNYSCTTPDPGGSGNITSEPQLASFSHLAVGSPCQGAGHSDYATGTDIDGEMWHVPPSMGCDEVVAGAITGTLSVSAWAVPTNVAVGFSIRFQADILGRTTRSVWDFGDGTVLSNRPHALHVYASPGVYAVWVQAYNESYPQGIMATVTVRVAAQVIHHVKLGNATPIAPYTSWETAATNIQDALDAADQAGALVLVSNGIYATGGRVVYGGLTNRLAITKPVTVRSVNGPAITIIQGAGPVGDSAVRCAYVGSHAVLEGFTLTHGATRSSGNGDRENNGGGVWCESSGVLSNCVLTGNSASYGGGASYGTLYTCTFTDNYSAFYGGGAYDGTLYNCTLTGNSAADGGGGMCGGTLYNCMLTGNSANYGGGVYNSTLYNCMLAGNSAADGGGGMYAGRLYNCTLTGNSAVSGGGMYGGWLCNCIIYYNTAPNYPNYVYSTLTYSCTTPDPGGVGNITNDPQFVNAALEDYHLQSTSPCINAGTIQDWMIGATDLDGNPRLDASGRVDMGAYEYQGMTIWPSTTAPERVDDGPDSAVELGVKFKSDVEGSITGIRFYKAVANTGAHVGNLWSSTGTLLATAVFSNETASGWQQVLFATPVTIASNRVYVASYHADNGHYSEDDYYFQEKGMDNPPLHALDNDVAAGNGVYCYGTSSLFPNQTWRAANYYVDVVFRPRPAPRPIHYVSPSGAHISPFTNWYTAATNIQAAIDVAVAGETVCVTNGVYDTGGRVAGGQALTNRVAVDKPLVVRSVNGPEVTIIQGQGPLGADAVRCVYMTDGAKLVGFTLTNGFTDNRLGEFVVAVGQGGGIYCESAEGVASNCILTGNSASYGGGAGNGTLYNCVLTGNSAYYGGGSFDCTLYNCTLAGNSGTWHGGGAFFGTLYNSILYYNTCPEGPNYSGGCIFNYSCTTPDPGGIGNITNDPRFVRAAAGDYHLQSTSPCINAGTNQDWMIGATDLDGNPRLDDSGRVDMGAYEYQGISIWPSTTAPLVVDAGPDSPVELGVKFKSDVAGTIAGIRFYKADANTGIHLGNLWTSHGTLLATVTFLHETDSGWQQAFFATPVTIVSNTVYVASYHVENGHYSEDDYYFQGKGVDNPPLHVLANGVSGGNGVYRYGASSLFPNQTWRAANYYVDVVFQPSLAPTLMFIVVTPANSNIVIGAKRQFMATGAYSDGSTQDITSQVIWTSSDTAVATIDAEGLATGISEGSTIISATLDDVVGSTTLTLQAAPLVITTTSLPNGVSNTVYTAMLAADGGTMPYTWSMISGTLPAGLTLSSGSGVIGGTPTVFGTFRFTVQVSDASSRIASKVLSITIMSMPTGITIWPSAMVPTVVDAGPDSPVALGVKFRSDVAGVIAGIRFYKARANTGVHVGNLWTSDGTLLATVTFSNETAAGWQQALFATPLAIDSNTVYVASYHANNGHYSEDDYYFEGKGMDNPPLHAPADDVVDGNGVYAYGSSSAFPNQTWHAANYWVDVVFLAGSSPTLTSIVVTPTNSSISTGASRQFTATGAYSDGRTRDITSEATWTSSNTGVAMIGAGGLTTGISNGVTTISATLSGVAGAATLTVNASLVITTTSLPAGAMNVAYTGTLTAAHGISPYLWSISNGSLPAGLTLNPGSGAITGSPTASGIFSFTAHVRDSCSPAQMATKPLSISVAMSIWSNTAAPERVDIGPDNPVELGVKFRSDVTGTIAGIRFYKSDANTDIHVGNLWTSNGTLLATVTFTNETASGWQQALFAAPVAIASDTVYVASYHANNGHYSVDEFYFRFLTKYVDNPPLHALADDIAGPNGVYAYGESSMFPDQGWNAANYWVDVVFLAGSPPPLLTSIPLMAAGDSSRAAAASAAGGNVERWPWVWTSGDFSKECGASHLIDGNTNTMWIGNPGGEPWRVILDLGVVTDVTGIQLMFQDTAWTNQEIVGSRDSEVWFDYLAETNEWVPLRYLYVNFWGDKHGAQPPAIREIIWRDR